jgi:hypothetical protein
MGLRKASWQPAGPRGAPGLSRAGQPAGAPKLLLNTRWVQQVVPLSFSIRICQPACSAGPPGLEALHYFKVAPNQTLMLMLQRLAGTACHDKQASKPPAWAQRDQARKPSQAPGCGARVRLGGNVILAECRPQGLCRSAAGPILLLFTSQTPYHLL